MKLCLANILTDLAAIHFHSHGTTVRPTHLIKPNEACCDWWGCDLIFHNRILVAVAIELLNKESGEQVSNSSEQRTT